MKNSKNQVGDKFKVLWNGIKAGLTNPKILKLNNFRILWRALRTESPKKIIENLYKLVSRTRQLEAFQDSDTPISYHVDEAIVLFGFLSVRGWVVTKEKLKAIQLLLSNGEIIDVAFSDKQADMLGVMTPKKGQILNSFLTKVAFDTEKKTEGVILKIIDVIGNKIENQLEIKIEEDYSKLTLNQQYQLFLADNEWTEQDDERIKKEAGKFSYEPLISIITPVYNVAPVYLDACIESVLNQFYHNWELCLYDDASTKPETIATLKKWKGYDERIKITFGQENQHISGASNHAIAISKGEFVGLLDHDDVLTPDALHEVIKALNKNKNLDFIYSDEDKMELDGSLADPHFKPDYNPDLLLSTNYICHFSVIRRSLGEQIGWFRKGFEGAQDYDLFLQIVEKTAAIYHIPKVLYHWRKVAESTAAGDGGKGYTDKAAKKALKEALSRRNLKGEVKKGIAVGTFKIHYTH